MLGHMCLRSSFWGKVIVFRSVSLKEINMKNAVWHYSHHSKEMNEGENHLYQEKFAAFLDYI